MPILAAAERRAHPDKLYIPVDDLYTIFRPHRRRQAGICALPGRKPEMKRAIRATPWYKYPDVPVNLYVGCALFVCAPQQKHISEAPCKNREVQTWAGRSCAAC